jgi:hypothetical protein
MKTACDALSSVVAVWLATAPREHAQDLWKTFITEMILPTLEKRNADGKGRAERYFLAVSRGEIGRNELLPRMLAAVDFFAQAARADFLGSQTEAWAFAAETKFWAGMTKASCQANKERVEESEKIVADLLKSFISEQNRKAANARHDMPDGSREKRRLIREAWASGRYASRDLCAQEEHFLLDMSFKTARAALRNTPPPNRA